MEIANFYGEFNKLSERRQRLLDSIEENDAEGLLSQLTSIYPDEAHFIYELLQNAEDAEATQAEFYLNSSSLRFRHDGKIRFTIEHIEAITNYGKSTKKVIENKIGKFGVGFKSVFSYTSMPIINSQGLTFSISRAILPKKVEMPPDFSNLFNDEFTTFLFSFDEPSKKPEKAFSEIFKGLEELDERSLLFLSNIKKIKIFFESNQECSKEMSRNQIDENLFSFEIIISGEPKNISYLILKGDIPKLESDVLDQSVIQNLRKMRIAIAFQLDTSQKIPVVQPINDANVCVYFPAIKERSGLKFHIHAPFASTPSRDVIKNSQENITILKGISALLVSNLENLKKKGYLTEGFFATLPGGDDELGPMYSHFREDIISEFKGKTSLIPTSDGGYIDAAHAITAPDNFQNSIQIETLQKMLQFRLGKDADAIKYSLNFKNARAQKFITNLKLKSFGLMELTKILNEFSSINQIKALQAIFQNISITEYRNILILFSHGSQKTLIELENLPFLMLNQENLVFGRPKDTFLPSPKFQDNGNLISKKIIDFSQKSQSEEQNLIKQGLQNLGVRVLDDWAMLDLNISKISKMHKLGDAVDESQIAESKEILENLLTEVGSDSDRIKSITALPIFIGITKEGSKIWSSLDRTFIDSPYEFTGLLSVREHLPEQHQIELWDGYLNVENFKKLLVHSRVMREVRPEKIPLPNRCSDWEIKNFDKMLETGDEQFLLHVWEMLTNAENQGLGWEIKTELSAGKLQYVDSSFVSDLRYSPWLPDLNGKKLRPTFITQASLNQKFVYKQTKLVEAIKFDGSSKEAIQRERKLAIQRQERNELAQELGFKDFAEVEAFQKLKSLQPKLISDLINSLEYHFPEEIVQDFEAKMVESAKILGSAVEVKVVESLIRERKNYKETHRAMKEFLRNKYYVGEVMKCQICSLIMPFKLLNGKYYFEAVFFIRNLEREFQCNGLALCPTCAARFQNTLQMSAHELRSEVLNATILGTGSSSIRIKMTNSEFNLSFTDDHLLELKTILREIEI